MAFELMQGNKCAMADESLWGEYYALKDVNRFATTEHFWDCECERIIFIPKVFRFVRIAERSAMSVQIHGRMKCSPR